MAQEKKWQRYAVRILDEPDPYGEATFEPRDANDRFPWVEWRGPEDRRELRVHGTAAPGGLR